VVGASIGGEVSTGNSGAELGTGSGARVGTATFVSGVCGAVSVVVESLLEAFLKAAKASMSRATESTNRSIRANSLGFAVGLCIEAVVRPIREFAIAASVDSGEVDVVEADVVVAAADAA
jgi:hypothetical protein